MRSEAKEAAYNDEMQRLADLQQAQRQREQNERSALEKAERDRRNALGTVRDAGTLGDPYKVWLAANDAITRYTAAGASYVAAVVYDEDQEADISDDEHDSDLAALHDDLHPEISAVRASHEGAAAEEQEEDHAAPSEEEQPDGYDGDVDGDADANADVSGGFDYSACYLRYLAGSSDMVGRELHRAASAEGDSNVEDEEAIDILQNTGVTLRLLDEPQLPSVEVQSVIESSQVKFFNGMPKVGAYYALPCKIASGELVCILCFDTCSPDGDGIPLSSKERWFAAEVAKSTEAGLESVEEQKRQLKEDAKEELAKLQQHLTDVDNTIRSELTHKYTEQQEQPVNASEETQAANDDDAAATGTDMEGDKESEQIEEGEYERARREAHENFNQAAEALETASARVSRFMRRLGAVGARLTELSSRGEADVKLYAHKPPKRTFKLIKGAMQLLGYDEAAFTTWTECRRNVTAELFKSLASVDPRDKTITDELNALRPYVHGLDAQQVAKETVIGPVLRVFITEARRVAAATEEKMQREAEFNEAKAEYHARVQEEENAIAEAEAAKEQADAEEAEEANDEDAE